MDILYIILKYLGSYNKSKSWFYVMVVVVMMMIMLERYWKNNTISQYKLLSLCTQFVPVLLLS